MRNFVFPFFVLVLSILFSDCQAQNEFPEDFQIITIAKQVDTLIAVNFICDASFNNLSFKYTIAESNGSGKFSSSGRTAGASVNTGLTYLQIKNKPLYITINGFPELIIPSVFVPDDIRVVGDGQVIRNESSLSRTAVWNCKTTVADDESFCDAIKALFDEFHGTGEVMLIPVACVHDKEHDTPHCFSETFLPGEATARKVASRYLLHSINEDGVYNDIYSVGRASSMPAVLNASATKYMISGDMKPGFYRWFAPDLSNVFVWAPNMDACEKQYGSFTEDMKRIIYSVLYYDSLYQNKKPVFPALTGSDNQYNKELVSYWKSFRYFLIPGEGYEKLYLPKLSVIPAVRAFEKMEKQFDMPASLMGEHPVFYPHQLSNEMMHNISLCDNAVSNILTTEKLYTILAMLKGGFGAYPQQIIDKVWKQILLPGEVVNNGVDEVLTEVDSLLSAALYELSLFVSTQENGRPLVIFNPSAHTATDVVSWPLGLPVSLSEPSAGKRSPRNNQNWIVLDQDGDTLAAQMIKSGNDSHILFEAENVPGIGLKTFYLKASPINTAPMAHYLANAGMTIENDDVKILSGNKIVEKQKNITLTEVCSVLVCNGKSGDTVYNSSNENIRWMKMYDGIVASSAYAVLSTPLGKIRFAITLFHQSGKISYDLSINQTPDNASEYVIKVPVAPSIKHANVKYKTPYGISASGRSEVADDVFPFPFNKRIKNVLHWAAIGDDKNSVLVSGDYLYCEMDEKTNGAFIVTPLFFPVNNSLFQKHLEIQLFSSNNSDLYTTGDAFATPLLTVNAPGKNMSMLPGEVSFFALRNKNLSVTAIKKAQNTDDVVIRIVEPFGKDGFALMEPMFSFSAFSSANLKESKIKDLNAPATIKPKLKAPVKAFSINTFILHP